MKIAAVFLLVATLLPLPAAAGGLDACARNGHNPLWTLINNSDDVKPSIVRDQFPLPESALVNSAAFGLDRLTINLLKAGQTSDAKAKALYTAASLGRLTTTAVLIASGVSPNAEIEGNDNITPLFGAVQYGCNDEVKYLIRMGADVNKQAGTKFTLLELAISERNYQTASLLMKLGYLSNVSEKRRIRDILEKQGEIAFFDRIFGQSK